MTVLKLKLFGQMECQLPDGGLLSLSTRKSEALLAYLVLTPGVYHSRDRLVNLLWSDRGEDQARNSLRQSLSSLKKSLDLYLPEVLEVERTTVSLKTDSIEVDTEEFKRLATETDIESLTSAASICQGELLQGLVIRDAACEAWLSAQRESFNRIFVDVLTRLSQLQLDQSDFNSAIESAERLVASDPLEESAWRLLMIAYQHKGNRNHALMAYKRFCEVLQKELGVEPELATRELHRQIMEGRIKPVERELVASKDAIPVVASITKSPEQKSPLEKLHNIAILPFDNLSGAPEQEYFSDGITESIILNLSLFPYLNVKSRNSSFAFKKQIKSLGEISKELNVDYVVEGSIRKSNDRIRITVQLIEAQSGNQIWGNRYESDLSNLFDLEEDLSRTIAVTVTGQIESELQRIAIAKSAAGQKSYDLLLSGKYHCYKFTREGMVVAQEKFEACLELDPANVQAHALLYECHIVIWMERWVVDYEQAFKTAGDYIHKALKLDPEVGMVQIYYAEYLIFCRENEAAARHVDRVLSINPNNPDALATKAFNLNAIGEYELALEISKNCQQLDPYNPWVDWIVAEAQLFTGDPGEAIKTILNSKTTISYLKALLVVAYSQIGDEVRANQSMQQFLRLCRDSMLSMPSNKDEWIKYWSDNLPYRDTRLVDELIEHLMNSGLCDETENQKSKIDLETEPSIIVLPFENMSGEPEQVYFSDGITESIILALSASKDLQVKSRHTSFAFRHSPLTISAIGEELGIQYIVEGSIRKFGDQVRITVQLGEVSSGNQIWGKRYDSPLDQLFELEEDLVHTIAGTISGRIGHEIKISSVSKPSRNLKSFDYLARGNYHLEKFTRDENTIAKDLLQKCIEIAPNNSDAHTSLAIAMFVELFEGWAIDRQASKELALQHMQTALGLEPENALTHAYLSEFQLFTRNFELGLYHAGRSIELGPHIPDGYAIKGYLLAITGKQQEALKLADISLRIDPYHYYMGWNAGEVYRICGQYQKALDTFRSIPHPPAGLYAEMAACLIGLGQIDRAKVEMQTFRRLAREQMVAYPESEKAWYRHWYEVVPYDNDEEFEVYFYQLLQAGLCDDIDNKVDDMPSIAVLPFENMSGDPEQEFFSDGITTDIISTLSRFRNLHTVARHSTLQYRDQKASIEDIAKQHNVRYILEGSIRKSGARIRVNADLIDSSNGEICWSERYDRVLDDIFAVQDDITKNISVAMKVHLQDGERIYQRASGTQNIKAWELVLGASDLQDSYIHQNILQARSLINKALELDLDYCFAWVNLGWTYWQEAYTGWCDSFEESISQSEKAVEKALRLEPKNADAWILKGHNYLMNNQADKGLEASKKAVELEPGNSEIQMLMALTCCQIDEFELASEYYRTAMKLCPVCPTWYFLVGGEIEQHIGNWENAIRLFRQAVTVEPDSPLGRFYLIDALLEQGDEAGAKQLAEEIRALDKSINGKGLVRFHSQNSDRRKHFRDNLVKMGFEA